MTVAIPLSPRVVTVCFASGDDADWFAASDLVNDHLNAVGTPDRRYRVRHRMLIGWITRFFGYYLLDSVRRFGAVMNAAGGRVGRLDLTATVTQASKHATDRWHAWHHHIANTTPNARTWEDFLAMHHKDPAKLSRTEARRRFEQQPRVLAMLAYAGGHTFDPYELDAYQSGQAAYAALHWRIALVGDALITTDGRLLQPVSPSLADRLRYLSEACRYVRNLRSSERLCAVAIS